MEFKNLMLGQSPLCKKVLMKNAISFIGNKTSMIFTRYRTLIFFILSLVTHTEYLRFTNRLLCGDIETNPGRFSRCKIISFYHWNLYDLLVRNREKFHLVEAFVVSSNIDIFFIARNVS